MRYFRIIKLSPYGKREVLTENHVSSYGHNRALREVTNLPWESIYFVRRVDHSTLLFQEINSPNTYYVEEI